MTVCLDTNVVLGMFGHTAPLLRLREGLLAGRFVWALSSEIMLEYEEIVAREMSVAEAAKMLRFIELVDQTRGVIDFVSPAFHFHVIPHDPDDNKFADCAIAAGADFVITEDHHFQSLAGAGYKPQPISPAEFIRQHLSGK